MSYLPNKTENSNQAINSLRKHSIVKSASPEKSSNGKVQIFRSVNYFSMRTFINKVHFIIYLNLRYYNVTLKSSNIAINVSMKIKIVFWI